MIKPWTRRLNGFFNRFVQQQQQLLDQAHFIMLRDVYRLCGSSSGGAEKGIVVESNSLLQQNCEYLALRHFLVRLPHDAPDHMRYSMTIFGYMAAVQFELSTK